MSRSYSHINTATKILSEYKGEGPFALSLRSFFSANKKYGSKDRKQIGQLCYSWLRAGHLLKGIEMAEAILIAEFLCIHESNDLIKEMKPEWSEKCSLPFEKKCEYLSLEPSRIFPFGDKLSGQIDPGSFSESMLLQPDLFIRIRPDHKETVMNKLDLAGIVYKIAENNGLRFTNTTKLDDVLETDKEIVIQDISSQRIGEVLKELDGFSIRKIWDCCAASGGKSILAWDLLGPLDLTVSDVRKNILANLEKRFAVAGITVFKRFQADLSAPDFKTGKEAYDLVIADVPCSGSGTWSRTPEQLHYFKKGKIGEYQSLQQKIMSNTWPSLKPGGFYLYITCSVFEMENEQQSEFLQKHFSAELIRTEYLKGFTEKADTLFFALLKKKL